MITTQTIFQGTAYKSRIDINFSYPIASSINFDIVVWFHSNMGFQSFSTSISITISISNSISYLFRFYFKIQFQFQSLFELSFNFIIFLISIQFTHTRVSISVSGSIFDSITICSIYILRAQLRVLSILNSILFSISISISISILSRFHTR